MNQQQFEDLEWLDNHLRNLKTWMLNDKEKDPNSVGFCMRSWMEEDNHCRTIACAIGHFCLARPNDDLSIGAFGIPFLKTSLLSSLDASSTDAIMERFGITGKETDALFFESDADASAVTVAERIEKVLKGYKPKVFPEQKQELELAQELVEA